MRHKCRFWCRAFASTEQIESDGIRTLGNPLNLILSSQQIASCDTTDSGCNGGNADTALVRAFPYLLVTLLSIH